MHAMGHTFGSHTSEHVNLSSVAKEVAVSQIENGESITLTSLIQILRSLDSLYVLNSFEVIDEISPLEYAKIKKKQKQRARNKPSDGPDKEVSGW